MTTLELLSGVVLLLTTLLVAGRVNAPKKSTPPPPPEPEPLMSDPRSGLLADRSIDPAFLERTIQIASELGADPGYLLAVMGFETSWTLRADIRNPRSSATGLIQWLESSARLQGTSTAELAHMTALEQLEHVRDYFLRQRSDWSDLDPSDVYLAVFAPKFVGKADDLPAHVSPSKAYTDNRELDRNGDGTITVGEVRATIRAARRKVDTLGWMENA